jgi:hypothetical protein
MRKSGLLVLGALATILITDVVSSSARSRARDVLEVRGGDKGIGIGCNGVIQFSYCNRDAKCSAAEGVDACFLLSEEACTTCQSTAQNDYWQYEQPANVRIESTDFEENGCGIMLDSTFSGAAHT